MLRRVETFGRDYLCSGALSSRGIGPGDVSRLDVILFAVDLGARVISNLVAQYSLVDGMQVMRQGLAHYNTLGEVPVTRADAPS